MEKEVTEVVKESTKIQQQFTQAAATLGSKLFEMHLIEDEMKALNEKFKAAYEKEKVVTTDETVATN